MTTTTNVPPRAGLVAALRAAHRHRPRHRRGGRPRDRRRAARRPARRARRRAPTPAARRAPGDVPVTYEQAKADGRQSTRSPGSTTAIRRPAASSCRPSTPRRACPAFTGDNGGATAPGVTADKITVVWYQLAPGRRRHGRAGRQHRPARSHAGRPPAKFVEMLNATWPRPTAARSSSSSTRARPPADDALAARAEAQEVIDRYKPFASDQRAGAHARLRRGAGRPGRPVPRLRGRAGRPGLPGQRARTCGERRPSPEQWLTIVSEYVGKRLAGPPGQVGGRSRAAARATRKFGVVNFEQDPPQFSALSQHRRRLRVGHRLDAAPCSETYLATDDDRTGPPRSSPSSRPRGSPRCCSWATRSCPSRSPPRRPSRATSPSGSSPARRSPTLHRPRPPLRPAPVGARLRSLAAGRVHPRASRSTAWRLHEWYYGTPPKAEKTSAIAVAAASSSSSTASTWPGPT